MSYLLRAALAVAAIGAPAAANATTFFKFDFATKGVGSREMVAGFAQNPTFTTISNAVISVYFPTTDLFTASGDGTFIKFLPAGSVSETASGVSFGQNLPSGRGGLLIASANACFANPVLGPAPALGYFHAGLSCGSASFDITDGQSFHATYTGSVDALTVSVVNTDDFIGSGVFYVNGVPEPTTWALMLTGFGMTGYALRRRRAVVMA